MKVRSVYCLTCWGHAHQICLDEWKRIVVAWEEDGVNQIWFWLAGLFRSKTYPKTFIYHGGMTTKDIHKLIRYAHKKGMEFFLGTGLFAWFGLNEMIKKYPETEAKNKVNWTKLPAHWWNFGFCPSHPKSREINLNYCLEMVNEFPEADGFYLEVRDEYGPCVCEECTKTLNEHGEKGYGKSKATFLEDLSNTVWKKNPNFKFAIAIGYVQETGDLDVAYYDWILSKKSDIRWIWFNARWAEEYPSLDGKKRPFTELSNQIIYWTKQRGVPVMDELNHLRKWKKVSNFGICCTFEPGARWRELPASKIPNTLESISTKLYRITFREFWKNLEISDEEFKKKVFEDLFKPNKDRHLLDMLFSLHRLYLKLIPYEKLQEKVDTLNIRTLVYSPRSAGIRDVKAFDKVFRNIKCVVEKNRPLLSEVQEYLKTRKTTESAGVSLLEEGIIYCSKFASKGFIKKLDTVLEYFQLIEAKREKG